MFLIALFKCAWLVRMPHIFQNSAPEVSFLSELNFILGLNIIIRVVFV